MWRIPSIERLYIDLRVARPGSFAAYALTVLLVAAATAGRLAIDSWISGSQFIFFFPAVILATFLFGIRAGALAVVLSAISAFYFILPPRFTFQLTGLPEVTALTVFSVVAAANVMIVGLLRSALVHLARVQGLDDAIFDFNPDAIVVTDMRGLITRLNRQTEILFGYSSQALLGQPVELLIPQAMRTIHVEHRTAFAAAPRTREMGAGLELLGQRANGETFPVHVQIAPITTIGGDRMIASVRDVTEQSSAAAALAESRQQQAVLEERQRGADELQRANQTLHAIIQSAPVGIWAIDEGGRVTIWNPPVAELYGISAEAVIGKPWHKVVKEKLPPDTRSTEDLVKLARRQGGFNDIEVQRLATDGTQRELSISAAPLRDGGDTLTGMLFVGYDLTRTKELERRLRQAHKLEAIGQLTGGVAHDFNNLLAVVYGNLEALSDDFDANSPVGQLIDGAMRAAQHGASLTRRLLAFSRQQKLAPTDVDVAALAVETTDMLRRMVEESIDIKTAIAPDLWKSRIDAEQLANALVNLVVNARDAMPEGGSLTIAAENATVTADDCRNIKDLTAGDYVKLSVTDTGAGMTKAVLERVLEPFFTTKPVGRGTGLGLSMVYGFVKQSGGHMTIASEPGRGTTVCLYLPRLAVEAKAAPTVNVETPVAATDGEVILLVEDDEMVRNLQVQSLHKLGYQTLEAEDGPACLDILKSPVRVDLLLTDIVLPKGMSGPAIAEAARKIRPGLKVVYMSGYAPGDVTKHYDLSGARSLAKPFTRADLARAMRETLEEA